MNARLMGNAQIVVGQQSGIDSRKWTNEPGLKIPAKDHNAFSVITPPYIPSYINQRREKAFYESELVSGRSDVTEGRRSGSLRSASAILALQEAGAKRVNHKKLMLQDGMRRVLNLVLDYVKEFMTTEQAFDILERDNVNYLWFRGSDLKSIPQVTLNENFNPNVPEDEMNKRYKPLYDEPQYDEQGNIIQDSKVLTKVAEFDIELYIGAGMPNNKSFIYESTVEMHRENLITTEEARATIKKILNWPIIDPWEPEGTFAGRNSSAEQLAVANSIGTPIPPQVAPMMEQSEADVIIAELTAAFNDGTANPDQIRQMVSNLPQELQIELMQKLNASGGLQ
jgi:glutaredoxin-related protein